jgi:hypothetical protein
MALSTGALQHGDRSAREVSTRIGGYVATTALLAALPLRQLADGQLWVVGATGMAFWYKSTAVATEGGVACTAGGRFLPVGVNQRVITITDADLTTATNGTAQTINVGTALPTGAHVLNAELYLTTQFTGGSASAVTLSVGISGATTSLINAFDAFGSTASAYYLAGASTAARPRGNYSASQIIATFTPDAGHTLAGLTAGSVTIDVLYAVP